jgi:hypothetical protein
LWTGSNERKVNPGVPVISADPRTADAAGRRVSFSDRQCAGIDGIDGDLICCEQVDGLLRLFDVAFSPSLLGKRESGNSLANQMMFLRP